MDKHVFSLRQIRKSRPGAEGFSLHVERLDIPRSALLALVGPSGCGKSTALDLLACILRPDALPTPAQAPAQAPTQAAHVEQRFLFSPEQHENIDVLQAWSTGGPNALAQIRQRHLGYVLQTGGLLPFLTAGDNILLRCRRLGCVEERRPQVQAIVEGLGIGRLLEQYPGTLSVGERQRAAIAAALAHGPDVVLADEPTAALDPMHARNALRIFTDLARKLHITVIMVTHNLEMVQQAGFTPIKVTPEESEKGIVSRIISRIDHAADSAPPGGKRGNALNDMSGNAPNDMPGNAPNDMPGGKRGNAHGSMPGNAPNDMRGNAPNGMPNDREIRL